MKTREIYRIAIILITLYSVTFAQIDLGGDVVSRYVWRGTDFGNAASVQPYISWTLGNFGIGAWASYPLCAVSGVNENDLYISYSLGNFGLTLTDYYFPESLSLFDYSDDGTHILEASVSAGFRSVSMLGAINFWGDSDKSFYVEGGYGFYEKDDISLSLVVGLGNAIYTTDGGFNIVNLGLSATKSNLSASFIINPEAGTDYLVLGYSF